MKVLEIRKSLESCAEAGWYGYDFILNTPADENFIQHIGKTGDLLFLSALKKPFFKISRENIIIKGLCGEKTIRVGISDKKEKELLNQTKEMMEDFPR